MIAKPTTDSPLAAPPLLAPRARWQGVQRPYTAADVARLRGTVHLEHTLAQRGAERLWELLASRDYVHALGALTGQQAVQQVRAGLEAIYVSGWQVAADANLAGQTYPDQILYPANSVPNVVRRINQALLRADQIEHAERLDAARQDTRANGHGSAERHWLAPLVADAEAGFGGPLNAFELMKAMIEAGAAKGRAMRFRPGGSFPSRRLFPCRRTDPRRVRSRGHPVQQRGHCHQRDR